MRAAAAAEGAKVNLLDEKWRFITAKNDPTK
jgi:hypothetical protein